MADAKDNDTSTPGPKAAGGSGAVKPPVLEGTARPAMGSSDKPEAPKPTPAAAGPGADKAEAKPAEKPAPKPDLPRDETQNGNGSPWLAGIVGGVLGLGAAYGLAFFGLWPTAPVTPPPADPRVAQSAAAIPELQTVTSTVQGELATLTQRVGALETNIAALPAAASQAEPAATTDTGLVAKLAALAEQVDALAKAPAADSGAHEANTAAIAALQTELASLRQNFDSEVHGLSGQIASINDTVSAGASAEDGRARLPLILSGLETAFASGRGYAGELAALGQTLPGALVPPAIAAAAESGLARPDEVVRRFNDILPDILAGRPASADAEWQDAALDWFRGLVAMRPTGDVAGDSPDAIVARLEAALARRDFVAARSELDALPEPMRAAAGSVGTDIATLAEAEIFLAALRAEALAVEGGQ